MSKLKPDELAAEARRWLVRFRGPLSPAYRRVRVALDDYYDDGAVLDTIRKATAKLPR
jgi:hypothetical protein